MSQALNTVLSLIASLAGIAIAAIAAVEGVLRAALAQLAVPHELQSVVLIAVGVLLALATLSLFGRILGALVGIFVVLLVIHIVDPGSAHLAGGMR
jgi:drug/metabolite transporter superfamily protein YnfA